MRFPCGCFKKNVQGPFFSKKYSSLFRWSHAKRRIDVNNEVFSASAVVSSQIFVKRLMWFIWDISARKLWSLLETGVYSMILWQFNCKQTLFKRCVGFWGHLVFTVNTFGKCSGFNKSKGSNGGSLPCWTPSTLNKMCIHKVVLVSLVLSADVKDPLCPSFFFFCEAYMLNFSAPCSCASRVGVENWGSELNWSGTGSLSLGDCARDRVRLEMLLPFFFFFPTATNVICPNFFVYHSQANIH